MILFPAGQDPSAPLPLRGCRAPRRFPAEPLPNMYRPPKDGRRLKYRSSPDSNLSRHSFSAAVPHSRSSHSPVQSRYVPFRDTVPHCAPRRALRWFRSACRRLSAPQKVPSVFRSAPLLRACRPHTAASGRKTARLHSEGGKRFCLPPTDSGAGRPLFSPRRVRPHHMQSVLP